jgi:hypothetical protein
MHPDPAAGQRRAPRHGKTDYAAPDDNQGFV